MIRSKLISLRLTQRILNRLDVVAAETPSQSRPAAIEKLLNIYEGHDFDALTLKIKTMYESGFTPAQIRSLKLLRTFLDFVLSKS